MKFYKKQKNSRGFTKNRNGGFTLVETLVAIFILVVALNGFFALIAGSIFSARYARNEITANYLMQEVIDYVRNDRDTTAFQNMTDPARWVTFLDKYGYNGGAGSNKCFAGSLNSQAGCDIEPADDSIVTCSTPASSTFGTTDCRRLNYDDSASNKGFYTYQPIGVPSNFKRQVLMYVDPSSPAGTNQVTVRVTVEWLNGSLMRSRSLQVSLLNWQN